MLTSIGRTLSAASDQAKQTNDMASAALRTSRNTSQPSPLSQTYNPSAVSNASSLHTNPLFETQTQQSYTNQNWDSDFEIERPKSSFTDAPDAHLGSDLYAQSSASQPRQSRDPHELSFDKNAPRHHYNSEMIDPVPSQMRTPVEPLEAQDNFFTEHKSALRAAGATAFTGGLMGAIALGAHLGNKAKED